MNNKFTTIISALFLLACAGFLGFVFYYEKTYSSHESPYAAYVDETYGFRLLYPKDLIPETTFKRFYVLSDMWRARAPEGEDGIGLVAIPVFRIDQGGIATGKPYPLYFDAEVRVGVSADANVVKNCFAPDEGYTNQKITDVVINGTSFKKFEFEDAAMMQYMKGESYRTVHNNRCYVVEQLETGSRYRDDSMATGTPDSVLNGYYQKAGEIVKTFEFIN